MGQCLCRKAEDQVNAIKQDKNIDDKRMLKVGIDVLNRDFCIQIGYNRKAVKTYGQGEPSLHLKVGEGAGDEVPDATLSQPPENVVS